jgi:ethanolamine utilization protein EutN
MCAHMQLARVIGTVVASQKYEGLEGAKFLLVQPLDHAQKPVGGPAVAVDTVRAGPGELVYTVGSREAALALTPWFVPVDLAIVGIVDDVATTPRETAASVFESVASSSRTRGAA